MGYKDFIAECRKGMIIYEFNNGTAVFSRNFFELDTYESIKYSKFFDKRRRLKKFLNEVKKRG